MVESAPTRRLYHLRFFFFLLWQECSGQLCWYWKAQTILGLVMAISGLSESFLSRIPSVIDASLRFSIFLAMSAAI